ncbi:hypothetical protein GUITHDRAFT_88647 [Guillardia theta CCMP2712]|uniref:Uncharacterized protein n=1 Tax=Guillardia theta (strain CCMP2712) TaxID=905079 RepID=L1IXR9_GUITC|nr:hypothetical protein GUITHDRAFT_88647 [Guillardia theta CCMP2712]EKX40635.1 hypothetical protein GUITHDRAFT_88647 [Guillardia theta CCMP2712]|eukprot:XP_005827615.1 hypothetical protein GUITHDRAFT_88647 [Guillardia theta CCMP2712]
MLQEATCFAPPSLLAPSSPKLTASSPKLTASPRFPRATSHRLCEMSVSEYETLKGLRVKNVKTCEGADIVSPSGRRLLVFLTHFGDLSSWEYARQLLHYMPLLHSRGVKVMAIGIGSQEAGKKFADQLKFPEELLFFDPDASCAAELGFSAGFGRSSARDAQSNPLSPYLRLLPMLLGIGSPGTLGQVIYGYFGDRGYDPKWTVSHLRDFATGSFPFVEPELFDRLGSGYLRPFELATVRLQNMIGILEQWNELIPENQDLVVQQGGTIVMEGDQTIYRFDDRGILVYAGERGVASVPQVIEKALGEKL